MKKVITILTTVILTVFSLSTMAQDKVIVVPLISNGSELKPIKPRDLIETRRAFTVYADKLTIGNVTDSRAFVITSITVSPESYPASLSPIRLRFCRTVGGCSHSFAVPNNTISKIDFGLGDLFAYNGTHYIDLTSRGGLPQNVGNQIIVFVSGYFYDK